MPTSTARRRSPAPDRYLAAFRVLLARDKELAFAFNDLRRSTAFQRLLAMRSLGLIGPDDVSLFSEETRERIRRWDEATKRRRR